MKPSLVSRFSLCLSVRSSPYIHRSFLFIFFYLSPCLICSLFSSVQFGSALPDRNLCQDTILCQSTNFREGNHPQRQRQEFNVEDTNPTILNRASITTKSNFIRTLILPSSNSNSGRSKIIHKYLHEGFARPRHAYSQFNVYNFFLPRSHYTKAFDYGRLNGLMLSPIISLGRE